MYMKQIGLCRLLSNLTMNMEIGNVYYDFESPSVLFVPPPLWMNCKPSLNVT